MSNAERVIKRFDNKHGSIIRPVSGSTLAIGFCPHCGEQSYHLWPYYGNYYSGCRRKDKCATPAVIFGRGSARATKQNKQSTVKGIKKMNTTSTPLLPANWKQHNHDLYSPYWDSLPSVGKSDHALEYVIGRKLPDDEFRYDPYNDSLVFALRDIDGQILYLKERYLYSRTNKQRYSYKVECLGQKAHKPPFMLYGLHRIDVSRTVHITEGSFDCLAYSNGISNEGSAIGIDKLKYIKSVIPHRIWVPDNDVSGDGFAEKLESMGEVVERLNSACKDPNELLRHIIGAKYLDSGEAYSGERWEIEQHRLWQDRDEENKWDEIDMWGDIA